MNFNEIESESDIYSFFEERRITETSEDHTLFKIDKRHFLRLIIKEDIDRAIAKEIKKEYSGQEEFVNHLLIVRNDFRLFIFKHLYSDPDTVVYNKDKDYASDTEQSLMQKLNSLKYEDGKDNDLFYELFDVKEVVDKFYQKYRDLRDELAESIVRSPKPAFLAQIILDRIIFIYFLQVKGILPPNYLATLYYNMKSGEEYYSDYLHPIFFELFNKEEEERDPDLDERFPNIPYLNGGLFSMVEGVEIENGKIIPIQIGNEIWGKIFKLFNSYEWIIEEESGDSVSITPSMLGHIYEKSVVQKETGSYYTPNQITDYISKNTIHPYLINCLNEEFDTEYEDIIALLDKGNYTKEDLKQISSLYFDFLKELTVCDPACGSGAFLIAAEYCLLNIYEKCISILRNTAYFEEEKERINEYETEKYFIKREIITKNIFGVDIQEGCIEISKLRLWLSMISEMDENVENLEPLPNIDYNIMTGNSLIGYTELPDPNEIRRELKGDQKKIDEWFDDYEQEDPIPQILNNLQEKKIQYRKTQSSEESGEIREYLSENIQPLRDALDELYCKEVDIENEEEIKPKGGMNTDEGAQYMLEQLREISSESEIIRWKINLQKPNSIDYDRDIRSHKSSIMGYKRNGVVSSIYPTTAFNYDNYSEKGAIADLVEDIIDDWSEVKSLEITKKISKSDLNEIGSFHWGLEFYDVFENKGFTIVIGNPPYIRQEKIDDLAGGMDYKSMLGNIYGGDVKTDENPDNKLGNTMDFSMYFIVRSRQLLRNKGYHSFIITNKWLRASYGEPIRHFLKHKVQLTKFIDFIYCNVFRGIGVDTVVFSFRKSEETDGKISYCCPSSLDNFAESDHDYYCDQKLLDDKVWSFSDPLTSDINQYIDSVGTPLKDMEVEINRGVTTGFNDAFIIDTKTRNWIIKQDQKCAEIIKPLVKGKNINRYDIQWDDWWLIFTRRGIDIDQYPIIKEYLQKFREDLEPKPSDWKSRNITRGRKPGNYKWYEIQDSTEYYKDFEKPKIISTKASDKPSFALDDHNFYLLNTSYVFNSGSKLILGILNSKLCEFYIKESMSQLGNNFEPKVDELEMFPMISSRISFDIVDYLHIDQRSFEELANYLVYELYFHSKFHEDGLYPEDKMYLLNAVKSHLRPIKYEEWSKLDWKRQLGEINDEETERLEKLTEQNNGIIEEAVESLENDDEVGNWIEVIKSHEWVRKINNSENKG